MILNRKTFFYNIYKHFGIQTSEFDQTICIQNKRATDKRDNITLSSIIDLLGR